MTAAAAEASTHTRLLDAALSIVRSEGVAALGVREVARRAGLSHNAPSRHFPTHEALCSAVATVGFREFCHALETAMDGLDEPFDRARAQARTYVQFALGEPGMFSLMWRHDLIDPTSDELAVVALRSFELLRNEVAACQQLGWNADVGTDTLAGVLWAWVHGIAQLWLTVGIPIFDMATQLDDHLNAGFTAFGLTNKEHQP